MALADRETCDRTGLPGGITDLEYGGSKCACYSPIFAIFCDGTRKPIGWPGGPTVEPTGGSDETNPA